MARGCWPMERPCKRSSNRNTWFSISARAPVLGLRLPRRRPRVYAVDEGGILEIARAICRANQLDDRVVHVKGLSTRVELPEKVDVVIADQIGYFGFEAGVIGYFNDARARLMKVGGVAIPGRIDLEIAPVSAPEMRQRVDFWASPVAGFDMSAVRPAAINTGYPVKFRADQLLGAPATIATIDFAGEVSETLKAEAWLVADRDGVLDGIGGWFTAQLSAHAGMTNSPLSGQSIRRRNLFFPIESPIEVSAGDRIRVAMHLLASEPLMRWQVR